MPKISGFPNIAKLLGSAAIFVFSFVVPTFAQTNNLLPNFDNPKFSFGTGKAINGTAELSSVRPEISGAQSGWTVIQWNQNSLISADSMQKNSPQTKDKDFGTANYAFSSADKHSHVWVYLNGQDNKPTYDLYEQGGALTSGGGSNLFLAANTLGPVSLNLEPILSLKARISNASIEYSTQDAKSSGAVLAQAFVGFVLEFSTPGRQKNGVLFLQIPLTNSRNTARFQAGCKMNHDDFRILAGGTLNNQPLLDFSVSPENLKSFSFNLRDYVEAVLHSHIICRSKAGDKRVVDFGSVSLEQVNLNRVYIGLETEDKDLRQGAKNYGLRQGNVAIGLQLSDVQLRYKD